MQCMEPNPNQKYRITAYTTFGLHTCVHVRVKCVRGRIGLHTYNTQWNYNHHYSYNFAYTHARVQRPVYHIFFSYDMRIDSKAYCMIGSNNTSKFFNFLSTLMMAQRAIIVDTCVIIFFQLMVINRLSQPQNNIFVNTIQLGKELLFLCGASLM